MFEEFFLGLKGLDIIHNSNPGNLIIILGNKFDFLII